ncbi:MAG: helix-turn-helix transcriptional regulator [Alphaproteobacteria bacterium]|nr:helix-turn-helix transcriptional regulator [Alphaproteobacteria bacterium]
MTAVATHLPSGRRVRVLGLTGPEVADLVLLPRAAYEALRAGATPTATPRPMPLRAWRRDRGLGVRELAAAAGIDAGYLSQIETGRKPGSVKALRALVRALGVPIEAIEPVAEGAGGG